ncbi:MAG TPA: phospholipase [Thermoanaerobaculia bacterium]|jgi:predicted esterase|nr:phospholipase [Thermoanaerobaculia bacterium]
MTHTRNAEAHLLARPGLGPGSAAVEPGLHELRLERRRDGVLYIPSGYRADVPAPLVVLLHGAGGSAHPALDPFRPLADDAGLILLAIDSRRQTWDVIQGGYGPDVAFLDRALALTFSTCAVEPARIAAQGFSDGASYALSLGVTNGDLFTHVIAFSPGFLAPTRQHGMPKIFISHGTRDEVLQIDSTSRRIVPQLRDAGYDVTYREYDGTHNVPDAIAREAVTWFTAKQ